MLSLSLMLRLGNPLRLITAAKRWLPGGRFDLCGPSQSGQGEAILGLPLRLEYEENILIARIS